MSDFTSQSGNFLSAFSGAVDPRTGMYNYNFSVAHLTGNAGLGPSMPVVLCYSPLNTTNTGYGIGVNLPVSSYDKSTRTLQLSSGERYKVSEANHALNIIHLNLSISGLKFERMVIIFSTKMVSPSV